MDQVATTALRKFSIIEDTSDLKPCHNTVAKEDGCEGGGGGGHSGGTVGVAQWVCHMSTPIEMY